MLWYIAVAVILLAALLLDAGLLAYSMYVLLGLLLLTRFLARSWINHLSASRTCTPPRSESSEEDDKDEKDRHNLTAEVGDRVKVRVTVRNSGRLPVPWVVLEDVLPQEALDKRFPKLKVKGKRLGIAMLRPGGKVDVAYTVECAARGYFPIGPLVMESGDLFGLHRRFRVEAEPAYLLVYPRIIPLEGYDLTSRRPIGDVLLTHRLFEDPTRISGVRPYELGDPLNRIHWRATARTGALHSKVHEPSTLAGATLLLDFYAAGYHQQGEPFRSELAVTATLALANAVYEMGQQVGFVTNGRDAADRIRTAASRGRQPPDDPRTRQAARAAAAMQEESHRLQPLMVETRRGVEQLHRIRETLARVELTDGLSFADLVTETTSRLPRDATLVAVLPDVPEETAIALGGLRRAGRAITVVLIQQEENQLQTSYGRLTAEGIRDIRHVKSEAEVPDLCRKQVDRSAPYAVV
ncbi:MAG TPA: DUF58 domain-containing protein [Gemmataceae bacterium]|nr:DUF58 domain-containing protein [Gemmataceae bacterium]